LAPLQGLLRLLCVAVLTQNNWDLVFELQDPNACKEAALLKHLAGSGLYQWLHVCVVCCRC
jgi:hypothetical protein